MKKRLIYFLTLLMLLFGIGAGLTIISTYRVTTSLEAVINLHRIEIMRQNLVINVQTVQQNVYTIGTAFGKELDSIVENVTALDNSVQSCAGCHHSQDMTARLKDVADSVEQYKEALSYLITSTANRERVERLKMVAVGIGESVLSKTTEMAFIAEKNLSKKTMEALEDIKRSRFILLGTIFLTLVIGVVIAQKLTQQITKPVNQLVESARMIAAGRFGQKTDVQDRTELGELAQTFNSMSESLKEKHERTLHHIEQLSGLYNITLSFYNIAEMEGAYQEICRHIVNLLKVRQCIIILYDHALGSFIPASAALDIDGGRRNVLSLTKEKMEELYRFSQGLPIVVDEVQGSGRFEPLVTDALGEKNFLVSWLTRKDTVVGAIRATDKEGGFEDEDVKLLTILASHMSVAMENAELYRSLQDQMTELRETQEQLIQSAKLAAIGELASNVAHEINNPLTSIIGFTELIKDETNINTIRNRLDIIESESIRARDIVRQLLNFARKRPLQVNEIDVGEAVREIIPLISSQAKKSNVELIEMYEELPRTTGDGNQLKQVFLNIMNNGIASMPDGGKLFVTTSRLGEYLLVAFKDTGTGIPREVIHRIFEPFFSTKKEKGTGLGLSISYRIVQDHGGRIDVESYDGKGTTFTVRLPIRSLPQAATA